MTNQHPITPPPGLVDQWIEQSGGYHPIPVAINAAQWGADQELEACCKWLKDFPHFIGIEEQLRAARRPKPPSLKEQALEALRHAPGPDYPNPITLLTADEHALIRRALEQLDD